MAPHEDTKQSPLVIVIGDGRVFGGRAVLFVLEQTGWRAPLMRLLDTRPFIWGVNAGYRIVANNRQVFSRIFFPGQPGCRDAGWTLGRRIRCDMHPGGH